jgi:acyl carrier protein
MKKNIVMEDIKTRIRAFILLEKNLPEQELKNDTPLISSGIIDSITTLSLVDFIEQTFGIEFEPYEVDQENLNSIDRIAEFIHKKQVH